MNKYKKPEGEYWQKPYLTIYLGGGPPDIKKIVILRGKIPKFRSFVIVTVFLLGGGVLNKYIKA